MQLTADDKKLCDNYKEHEFLVTNGVIKIMGLVPKNIILKCGPYHFPIILHRISINKAVVILQISDLTTDVLAKNDNNIAIRFYAREKRIGPPPFFFIGGKSLTPMAHPTKEMFSFLPIIFNDPCPSAIIHLMLPLFSITDRAKNRRDHRISIPFGQERVYRIDPNHCYIGHGDRLQRVVIDDLSISGAHLFILTTPLEKSTVLTLHLAMIGQEQAITLKCEIIKSFTIATNSELLSLSVKYLTNEIPVAYTIFFKQAIEAETISRNG